ncbi:Hypoxic response protein 1 [subsurface metagenome]
MLKAKDIMTRNVLTVKKGTPIYEAVEVMAKNNITGIPVVEDGMKLVGILTEKDVLNLFYAHEHEKNKTVGDFMSQTVVRFDRNTDLRDICDCLKNSNFRRVPVTSRGEVVGIVSRADIIQYILQMRFSSADTG